MITQPTCPDCKHPVSQHSDFFCMHINCYCNSGKATAQAKFERDVLRKQLDVAIKLCDDMNDYYADKRENYEKAFDEVMNLMYHSRAEIAKIGEGDV